MDWGKFRRSQNVQDMRGAGGGRTVAVGAGGLIIALVAGLLFGVNPAVILDQMQGGSGTTTQQAQPAGSSQDADFVSAVLGDTEDVWTNVFKRAGRSYDPPQLVLYSGATNTACGLGQAAAGPFYCPNDQKVYLDTSFFQEMQSQLNAPGDFARAYVIAHEVGHHVQNLLGILPKVNQAQQNASKSQANALSVRLELQADCLAGVWANSTQRRDLIDQADVQEGIGAATAVGDDTLQRRSQGYVVPDSFTHGSSAQRVQWFETGLKNGTIDACDTFNAR